MEQRTGHPIGIDLGTAYIRAAFSNGTKVTMIPDELGNSAMPSYVAFSDSRVLFGEDARAQALDNPANTIFNIIQLIGGHNSHISVQTYKRMWPFEVIVGPDKRLQVKVNLNGRPLQLEAVQICSLLLIKIKENAEIHLNTTVQDAVITVPACFNYEQRLTIKHAGMLAGLNFMQIISAPTASAFFYGLESLHKSSRPILSRTLSLFSNSHRENNMVIFDLGAGTLDVAVVTIKENKCTVRATAGDIHLDVYYFDNNLEINNEFYSKCINILQTCLQESKIDAVHKVILAGRFARIPLLKEYIQRFFKDMEPTISECLEFSTAYGAACQAFFLSQSGNECPRMSLFDAAPISLGLRSSQGEMHAVVPRNMNIPIKKEKIFHKSNRFQVYEGESKSISENNILGEVEFTESQISTMSPNIKVSIEIHENGILTVTAAEDKPHGITKTTCIPNNNIESSVNSLRNTLLYNGSGNNVKNASTTMSLTSSVTSQNRGEVSDTKTIAMITSIENDRPSKIIGQCSKKYVEAEEYAIGIDFGTTHSSVAVWRKNGVEIFENEYGSRLTCSVVAFTNTGRLIGDIVHKERDTTDPTNTIPNIKRLMGRRYSDLPAHHDKEFQPFEIIPCNDNIRPKVLVRYKNEEKKLAPEEIAAMILIKMREIAQVHLGSTVTKAVICVPASFGNSQRKALKNAGAIAGLDVLQLLNESTAAAIAYFLHNISGESSNEKILLIFDLGGGSLDVSIVEIKIGSIRVLAVAGDTNLGGEDFDNNMVSYFVDKFMKDKKRDIRDSSRSLRKLRASCEKAKRVLSTNAQTLVEIDALYEGIDFSNMLTRKTFEEINDDLFNRCIRCVETCLKDAEQVLKQDGRCIEEVVLIGGSTRIPKLQQDLQVLFNRTELCKRMNADEAVVYGAAVRAAILSGNEVIKKFELQDVTSQSFGMGMGMENNGGTIINLLIPKNTRIPASKELIFTTDTDSLSSFSIGLQECESSSKMVFTLSGIAPKPRVTSKVVVSLEVDKNGILNLTAKEMMAREENEIEVNEENRGLTTKELQEMVDAADRYKKEDEEQMACADALNSLESFSYKLKSFARDAEIPTPIKNSVMKDAEMEITWVETSHGATIDEITTRIKKLEKIKSQIAALSSLKNVAYNMKKIAREGGLIVSSKKLLEEAADKTIDWVETNHYAGIGEIISFNKRLETMIKPARLDALHSLKNFANEMKAMAMDKRVSDSSKKLVNEAVDIAFAFLAPNNLAGIDEIISHKKHMETIKIDVRSSASDKRPRKATNHHEGF